MLINVCDTRALAVAVSQPSTDKWYNWVTGGMETPFLATAHLKPLVPLEASPSIFAGVLTVDIGTILIERTDVMAVLVTVDGSGNAIGPVDVWTMPSPLASSVVGGFTR